MLFLVRFTYMGWCQGPEKMTETVLVRASNWNDAINKIQREKRFPNATDFINLTIQ